MNGKLRAIKVILFLAFVIAILVPLTACAPAALGAVEIGIEPTATPAVLRYTNVEYGFAFEYPTTWTLAEQDHAAILTQGSSRLTLNFRWVTENIDPTLGRTGMAAGTPIYSGKVAFLGMALPINVVELDNLRKYVIYGDTGSTEVGDLAFGIVLEDLQTDYMELNLPEQTISEANAILESFKRIPASGSPPPEMPATPTTGGAPPSTEVIAWLGHIASLPAGSQYDDMVVLSPSGTGEFGLTGSTPTLEAEIESLRDADGPREFVHLWGTLSCGGIPDYNDCQLTVDRLQYGANLTEQQISDWIGTIRSNTFNGSDGYVFVLNGAFPMWYGIWASQDADLQTQIQHFEQTGELVEVSGKLLVGFPDANGTRIEVSSVEARSMAGPRPDVGTSKTYSNAEYGFSFRYPDSMTVKEGANQVVVGQGSLEMVLAYRRLDETVSINDVPQPDGSLHPYTETYLMGQYVQPQLNVKDGYITGVYVGGPGAELPGGPSLRFVITMWDREDGRLSNGQVDSLLSILPTFRLSAGRS